MNIQIAERLRPYSHRPGTYAHIPGSQLRLQVFPACINIEEVSESTPKKSLSLQLGVTGPVEEFTVQQDLEKGDVVIWGRAREGFYRFRIRSFADRAGVTLSVEKYPEGCVLSCTGWQMEKQRPVVAGETYSFSDSVSNAGEGMLYAVPRMERLSLGSHKAQEWELICRRADFAEIFPLWHRLGMMVKAPIEATTPILEGCRQSVGCGDATLVLEKFREVFVACFDGLMAPRLSDPFWQGIAIPEVAKGKGVTPLTILSEGAALIRSLFVQVTPGNVALLPVGPPEFHAGRMLDVVCGDWGVLSFEWTKKVVRRVAVAVHKDTTIAFVGRSSQKSCRIRLSTKDRGVKYVLGEPLHLSAGVTYWLDNFQK